MFNIYEFKDSDLDGKKELEHDCRKVTYHLFNDEGKTDEELSNEFIFIIDRNDPTDVSLTKDYEAEGKGRIREGPKSKLFVNLQSFFGRKTWWLEVRTHGDVKITREISIEILCGLEKVLCVGLLCENEKIVLNRNI